MKVVKYLRNSSLIRGAGMYSVFNIIDRSIPFILLPIITRHLSTEEYGTYVLYQSFVGFVLPFITLNTDTAILINFFKVKAQEFGLYLSNGFIIVGISFLIFILLYFALNRPLSQFIDFPKNWLIAVVIVCPLQYLTRVVKGIWQMKKEAVKFGVYTISLTVLKNTLMIIFVVGFGYKWKGLILSQLIGWGTFALISIIILFKDKLFDFRFKKDIIRDNLKVGAPVTLHQLGGWLGNLSSRLIIGSLLGKAAVGSYGIGATFAMAMLLIQDAFNKAFTPYLFEKLTNINTKNKILIVRITYIYNLLILIIGLGIGVIGYYFVGLIFGSQYESSKQYIIILTLAYAFNGLYKAHVNYIFFSKKTYYLLYITLSTGIASVLLTYSMVNIIGISGAAYSLLTIYFITYILAWYVGNKVIPLPWFSFNVFRKE